MSNLECNCIINDVLPQYPVVRFFNAVKVKTLEVAHLMDGYAQYLEDLEKNYPLCVICLDQGIETLALPDHYKTFMYCKQHHPAHLTEITAGKNL